MRGICLYSFGGSGEGSLVCTINAVALLALDLSEVISLGILQCRSFVVLQYLLGHFKVSPKNVDQKTIRHLSGVLVGVTVASLLATFLIAIA